MGSIRSGKSGVPTGGGRGTTRTADGVLHLRGVSHKRMIEERIRAAARASVLDTPGRRTVAPYGESDSDEEGAASGTIMETIPVRAATNWSDDCPLDEVVFVAVDTETTGVDRTVDSVVEIGIVTMRGDGEVIDRWSSIVCPSNGWVAGTHVHGIDRDAMAAAPTIDKLLPEIAARMSGRPIVAHNANFDIEMLGSEFTRCGYEPGTLIVLDTRDLAAHLGCESQKLDDLAAQFGVELADAHRAWADGEACGHLLVKMAAKLEVETVGDLKAKMGCDAGIPGRWPIPAITDPVHRRMAEARDAVASGAVCPRPETMRGARWHRTSDDKWYVSAPADAGIEEGTVFGVKTKGSGKCAEVRATRVWPDPENEGRVLVTTKQQRAWTPEYQGGARIGEASLAGRPSRLRQAYKFGETCSDVEAVHRVGYEWDVTDSKGTYTVSVADLSCTCRGRIEGVCVHVSRAVYAAWPDHARPAPSAGADSALGVDDVLIDA